MIEMFILGIFFMLIIYLIYRINTLKEELGYVSEGNRLLRERVSSLSVHCTKVEDFLKWYNDQMDEISVHFKNLKVYKTGDKI